MPATLSNTATAILSAVDRMELGRRYSDAIYVEFREGIACAVKCRGQIVTGVYGMAGEMVCPPEWSGGKSGVDSSKPVYLEEVAGMPAILREAQAARHPAFVGHPMPSKAMRSVLALTLSGDEVISRILMRAWSTIGRTVGNMVNLLNPAVVMLDPHFGQAGQRALEALEQGMRAQMLPAHARGIELRVSHLEEPAAPVGAALELLDELTFGGAVIARWRGPAASPAVQRPRDRRA